jgi:hypothetical protein
VAVADPIRVYCQNGKWLVDYGSYAHSWYLTRGEAIKVQPWCGCGRRHVPTNGVHIQA